MGETLPEDESKAVHDFLSGQAEYEVLDIDADVLADGKTSIGNLTHVWIHQLSENRSEYKKSAVGNVLKKFVESGGNLILSMEAAGLLNDWGIEKNPLATKTDSITDNGFGRPLGFHAFKSHPVFKGLHGGAYPWKSKEDHIVRKIGFFDQNLPDTTIAKVIGIEWTYITFHEDNKLVLEYQLGAGSIIAIGAFSYFANDNYNTHELHRFYTNIFEHMAGNIKDVESNYWDYSPQTVGPLKQQFPPIPITPASEWDLTGFSIDMNKQVATDDVVIMSGRRIMVAGRQKGGIDEVWTSPFMSFRDIAAGIMLKDSDTVTWLNDLTPSITSSPELLVREYRIGETVLKEITVVSMDKPLGVVNYQWEGDGIAKVFIKYTSNFRYMWPYSQRVTSSIHYKWAPGINAAVASAQCGGLNNIMGFSSRPETIVLGQYEGFDLGNANGPQGIKTDLKQVSGLFGFDALSAGGKLSMYMMASDRELAETIEDYGIESLNFNRLFKKSSRYYKDLLANSLMLTTPDEAFNEGYRWALLRTDQFFQETPDIGTTMVAGFGTTDRGWDGGQKISGRPGYAWYFGRDAQWCGFAVNAYGGHRQVKKMLEVFARFQNLNGKIFHELTTSGAVHYDASDATPLYVVLASHYLKYSGDMDFIRRIWPSLKKAMDFCFSTDTDGDGLIEITNVGHGWIEGGALFGTHTEVYLAGCWAAALDAAAYITNALDKDNLSNLYKKEADKVKEIIDRDFWNKDRQYFYVGKMVDGTYMDEQTVLSGVPVYFDAVKDADKAFKTASSYASNQYSTDWGVRILPGTSKNFNPGSYHGGMVWPLFAGWAALAEYKTGNYVSGYSHIMNNLLVYDDWNLGSVEETLNGISYDPAGVCSQQGWSETMVLQPIYEGMLGLLPDAPSSTISLSPRFPWHWNEVKVDNIHMGSHTLGFEVSGNENSTVYYFKTTGIPTLVLKLSPSFPMGTKIKEVKADGKNIGYRVVQLSEGIQLVIDPIKPGLATSVEIFHEEGIGAIPLINYPGPGDTNKGAKILRQHLSGKQFDVVVEGLPGKTYRFRVMSKIGVKAVRNGRIVAQDDSIYTIETVIPKSSQKYAEQEISIDL